MLARGYSRETSYLKSSRTAVTGLVAVLVLAVAGCSNGASSGHASNQAVSSGTSSKLDPGKYEVSGNPLTIRTVNGAVAGTAQGTAQGTIRQFLGIPYAAPPVGDLRFQAPHPAANWTGTLDASKAGSECPQIVPIVNIVAGNENCLTINVFTPSPAPVHPRAVMVWIYGGGFTVGGSMDDNPANIVAKTGVVAVSFNYRLGPFGFLALPQLAALDPKHSTGDMGLQDQQAALQWVKANIARFGGDPGNVTIFGESAGGMSVCAQLASPGARGLFEKAITESGPCNLPAPGLSQAESQGAQFLQKLGCLVPSDDLACLDSKPVDQILNAMPPDPTFVFNRSVNWFPTADGKVLPTNTQQAFNRGEYDHIPIIVGANRDEGRLFAFLAYDASGRALPASSWPAEINAYFGPNVGAAVQQMYPLADFASPEASFGEALGDAFLACPAVETAASMAKYQPVYEYEFDYSNNPFVLAKPGDQLGAFHSSELPFVFGGPVQSSGNFTFTSAEQKLSDEMMGAWVRFAKTGNPDGNGIVWPKLSGQGGSYLSLNTPSPTVAKNMKGSLCGFWKTSGWSVLDVGKYGLASPNVFNSVPLGSAGAAGSSGFMTGTTLPAPSA
ncbi:MAG TPA: carboxylesterase/lipase family protein [Acidimicrobiales bacterium]|nr:carboxylesterase/lipase family protein [Acidimicrobiales bacterium]